MTIVGAWHAVNEPECTIYYGVLKCTMTYISTFRAERGWSGGWRRCAQKRRSQLSGDVQPQRCKNEKIQVWEKSNIFPLPFLPRLSPQKKKETRKFSWYATLLYCYSAAMQICAVFSFIFNSYTLFIKDEA